MEMDVRILPKPTGIVILAGTFGTGIRRIVPELQEQPLPSIRRRFREGEIDLEDAIEMIAESGNEIITADEEAELIALTRLI